MNKIDVPDWVARKVLAGYLRDWEDCSESNKRDLAKIMAESLTAALGAWVVPVGKVCMNGRRYGHGMFADIEVQYPTTTTPGPKIGSDLFTLRQEKPE